MNGTRISFRDKALVDNGKTRLVLSGEVQYFRTPRRYWRTVLDRLKEAHCDTLSTYIPWSWHELSEGVFDFTGRTHPSRDLVTFLRMAEDRGFLLVLKPGPYVFGEIKNGGVPPWFSRSHPEALAKGPGGKKLARALKFPHVTYLHPAYLASAQKWFDRVWPVLAPHAGRTVLWQVDNEINHSHCFFWFGPYGNDYNPSLTGEVYRDWLARKFGTVGAMNARYRSRHRSFTEALPPVEYHPTPGERCRTLDWIEFREWTAVEQVRLMCGHLHRLGAAGPFAVNAPFTGWGTAWNNTRRWLRGTPFEVVITHVDYPGMLNDSNLGETLGLIQYARSCGNVVEANLETQACTVSKIWGKHGASYDLTHKSLIGAGMNTANYYWFNDGFNFLGTGHYQSTHEFHCPLDVAGRPREHYFGIKRLNAFLKAHPAIASTSFRPEVSVGYVHEWGRANFLAGKDAAFEHRTNALLNLLGGCGVSFDMVDLRDWDPAVKGTGTMFVQAPVFMPRFAMQKLVDWVRGGGHLVLSNCLPRLDEDLAPREDLARALGAGPSREVPAKPGALQPNTISISGKQIVVFDRLQVFRPRRGTRIIATHEAGTCGFKRRVGLGRVSVLGFRLEYMFTDLHRAVLGSLLGRRLDSPCPVLTRSGEGTILKTVLNVDDEPHTTVVDGRKVRLPGKTAAWILTEGRRRSRRNGRSGVRGRRRTVFT